MRLIDADKLRNELLMIECMEEAVEIVDNQPTAYDVGKVVEKFDEIIADYVKFNPPCNYYEDGYEDGVEDMAEKAIEIVKAGVRIWRLKNVVVIVYIVQGGRLQKV